MRTTIDLTDDQRARLLELAQKRGERELDALVQEAVDEYLSAHGPVRSPTAAAKAVLGTADEEFGDHLEEAMHRARGQWR